MSYWKNITNITDDHGDINDERYSELLKNLDGEEFGEFLVSEVRLRHSSALEFLVNTLKYVVENGN